MKTSEKIDLISEALVKVQAEVKGAKESGTNPHFNSTFSTAADIWEVARPALAKCDLAAFQGGDFVGDRPVLVTRLVHKSGQWIESVLPLYCARPNDPQALGSAITYCKRYGLAAALGVVTEDDDGESATVQEDAWTPYNEQPKADEKPKTDEQPKTEAAAPGPTPKVTTFKFGGKNGFNRKARQ